MQFMSQSTGWADNIILAMAPLGIVTAIVGAIRVGGPSWLKAVIGRARESRAVAEAELMSSTSNEVCELWNGHEIVRVMGEGPIREFIVLLPEGSGEKGDQEESTTASPESVNTNETETSSIDDQMIAQEADEDFLVMDLKEAKKHEHLTEYRKCVHSTWMFQSDCLYRSNHDGAYLRHPRRTTPWFPKG
jgi:hypothetical protein